MKVSRCNLLRTSGAVISSICLFTPGLYAQKNPVKVVRPILTKPSVMQVRPPLLKAAQTPSVAQVLQQNLMTNWNVALAAETERQALQAVTAQRAELLWTQPPLPRPSPLSPYAQKQTQFLRDDLERNENVWPVYAPDSQDIYLLRRITNFMEAENPTPEVLEVQQEIIRLRAASAAASPETVLKRAERMLADGFVPPRVYLWSQDKYPQEVLVLGEEIAFAVAASKVPMKDNPWNTQGMKELADKVTTYNAMRRSTPLFEGLPETYTENGVQKPNIPVLVLAEYAAKQLEFAQDYPFEYALAPYRSAYLGVSLAHAFNEFSPIEKQAVLFTTPGLPNHTDKQISRNWYQEALALWKVTHPDRELRSFLSAKDEANFMDVLFRAGIPGHYVRMSFHNPEGGAPVSFKELPYAQQVEFLYWAWQHYKLTPQQILDTLYR